MPVGCVLPKVWVRLTILSQLSIIQYMGLCVFSLPISLLMIEVIYTLSYYHHQIGNMNCSPLFRLRTWTMVCAVCLSIFLWGQHGAHMGPVGPIWAPYWVQGPCYQGCLCALARWRGLPEDGDKRISATPVASGFLIARFMGTTWGPSGSDRTKVYPILAPWSLLSGVVYLRSETEARFPVEFGIL